MKLVTHPEPDLVFWVRFVDNDMLESLTQLPNRLMVLDFSNFLHPLPRHRGIERYLQQAHRRYRSLFL